MKKLLFILIIGGIFATTGMVLAGSPLFFQDRPSNGSFWWKPDPPSTPYLPTPPPEPVKVNYCDLFIYCLKHRGPEGSCKYDKNCDINGNKYSGDSADLAVIRKMCFLNP